MKFVHQTKFGAEGNCFSACLASFLEIPIDEIPYFADYGDEWMIILNKWLKPYGYHCLWITVSEDYLWSTKIYGYHFMTGDSPSGERHAVIGHNGALYHDPHPEKIGLVGNIDYGFLIPTWEAINENL